MSQDQDDKEQGSPQPDTGSAHLGDDARVGGDVFTGGKRAINTGGGPYHEGPLNVAGDYVGGNKTIHQTAGGDIVGRDKITTTSTNNYGLDPSQLQQLSEQFSRIQQQVAARPPDPAVDKDEIKDTVKRIESEAQKGDAANPAKVERLLINLGGMADDIFQVTAATLANPLYGIAKAIQLIAQKARAEQNKQAGTGS